ncbi:CCA tRNA nucleotidyltransferase [Candidatus Woesearchaeota archaeon]|nr:CCA tRNA nucleotidyltransferase [Candidatus Woesearchaeota archaeon]
MKEILSKISPTKQERTSFKNTISEFLKTLNSHLQDAAAILGGSGAKDTWLSHNTDIDIFVQYNYQKYSLQSDQLSQHLHQTLKKSFPRLKITRLHGSRDYFQLIYKKFNVEIIPILKISQAEQALNITDISPLHSQWVNAHAKKIKNDIRLAKQFCKAARVYGAESYINGFSGYILEILVAYYGSFEKLLKASLKWKPKEVIDPSHFYPQKDALFQLNQSKQQSPIIIIDPVDKSRNAAAALSKEKLTNFQRQGWEYLKQPHANFFLEKELSVKEFQAQAKKQSAFLLSLKLTSPSGKEDIVGVKILKCREFLKEKLAPFQILKSEWEWNKKNLAQFYFILKITELPSFTIRQGPPLAMTKFVNEFKKKNKDFFIKDNKMYAKIKTLHPQLLDFAQHLTKEPYFQERIKSVQEIKLY